MMPLKMMRSAAPDFGDHGRTHRAHDTIRDQRPNEWSGGLATDGEYPFLVRLGLGLDGRRGRPNIYHLYALRHLSNAQTARVWSD